MRMLLTRIHSPLLANLVNRLTRLMRANGDGDDVCDCAFNVIVSESSINFATEDVTT
jgi:hypothetical protein